MTLQVFAIRDTKAEAYMRPFFTQTKGLALRSFIEIAKDKEHPIGKYPGDYHLFRIAEYDDNTGKISPLDTKENMGCALDFLNPSESEYNSEPGDSRPQLVSET